VNWTLLALCLYLAGSVLFAGGTIILIALQLK
jgi:hypothetical protein